MTISVVIPAYNAGKYIGRAIDSILAQTCKPAEIIVVDDGSTDNTAEVVMGYGEKVKYIYRGNAGASVARNAGITAASGKWIAFLDADDEWLPENLQKQTELLGRNPGLMWTTANYIRCFCREGRRADGDNREKANEHLKGKDYFDSYFSAYMNRTYGWTGTIIIKREVFEKTGMFLEGDHRYHDMDMWFRIAYRYPGIGYTIEPVAVYHMNVPESLTKIYTDPILLNDFIERHLKISAEFDKLEQFKPCAERLLRYWIHRYWADERIKHIRETVIQFDSVLPKFYTLAIRMLTVWPGATQFCLPVFRQVNKLLRLRL